MNKKHHYPFVALAAGLMLILLSGASHAQQISAPIVGFKHYSFGTQVATPTMNLCVLSLNNRPLFERYLRRAMEGRYRVTFYYSEYRWGRGSRAVVRPDRHDGGR